MTDLCLVKAYDRFVAIAPTTRLRDCPEDQVGLSIPRPLNARLDALVQRVTAAGENTSRKELLAALLLEASEDPRALAEALRRYRTAEARDVAIPGVPEEEFLEHQEHRPGPRPRRGG